MCRRMRSEAATNVMGVKDKAHQRMLTEVRASLQAAAYENGILLIDEDTSGMGSRRLERSPGSLTIPHRGQVRQQF